VVTYEIDGQETTYKGLDGDEFHASVRWEGGALVFQIIEHEGGREIPQNTVWTLSDDRSTLQVDGTLTKSGKQSTLTKYVRQP